MKFKCGTDTCTLEFVRFYDEGNEVRDGYRLTFKTARDFVFRVEVFKDLFGVSETLFDSRDDDEPVKTDDGVSFSSPKQLREYIVRGDLWGIDETPHPAEFMVVAVPLKGTDANIFEYNTEAEAHGKKEELSGNPTYCGISIWRYSSWREEYRCVE